MKHALIWLAVHTLIPANATAALKTMAFCDGDDAGYGNLNPKLFWGRTKTLGRGNDCCDFLLYYKNSLKVEST